MQRAKRRQCEEREECDEVEKRWQRGARCRCQHQHQWVDHLQDGEQPPHDGGGRREEEDAARWASRLMQHVQQRRERMLEKTWEHRIQHQLAHAGESASEVSAALLSFFSGAPGSGHRSGCSSTLGSTAEPRDEPRAHTSPPRMFLLSATDSLPPRPVGEWSHEPRLARAGRLQAGPSSPTGARGTRRHDEGLEAGQERQ